MVLMSTVLHVYYLGIIKLQHSYQYLSWLPICLSWFTSVISPMASDVMATSWNMHRNRESCLIKFAIKSQDERKRFLDYPMKPSTSESEYLVVCLKGFFLEKTGYWHISRSYECDSINGINCHWCYTTSKGVQSRSLCKDEQSLLDNN